MPYLRLSSFPLDVAAKRYLADELTATVLDILPDQKPEWTTVQFTSYHPGDFAVAGRLVADGATPETHLDLSATGVDDKSWFALRNRLTDVIAEALAIPESERWHVHVKLNAYDPHTFAVAGNAADEIDGEGHLEATDDESGEGGAGWLRPAAVIGFGIGAFFGYRWLTERIGTDVTVDAAPPSAVSYDASRDTHPDRQPPAAEPRIAASGPNTTPHETAPVREY